MGCFTCDHMRSLQLQDLNLKYTPCLSSLEIEQEDAKASVQTSVMSSHRHMAKSTGSCCRHGHLRCVVRRSRVYISALGACSGIQGDCFWAEHIRSWAQTLIGHLQWTHIGRPAKREALTVSSRRRLAEYSLGRLGGSILRASRASQSRTSTHMLRLISPARPFSMPSRRVGFLSSSRDTRSCRTSNSPQPIQAHAIRL